MSKIRIQLLDENDVIRHQHIIDLNGRGAMEKIDEDLIDGNDWFNGLKIITKMWWPYCSGKESWAKEINKEHKLDESMARWTGYVNDTLYLYLKSLDGSYTLDKWHDRK
jgi:hypothetical protein